MIDGLRLTITGRELYDHFDERILATERRVDRAMKELAEPDQTSRVRWPDEYYHREIEKGEERVRVLRFMRDHVVTSEVYLLGEADLEFAEILPRDEEDPFDIPTCYDATRR